MQYRQFGRSGITVSAIGFGTWGLGGDAYGPADDRQSIACLRAALDRGVNFYDTAALYGQGRSEDVVGTAFQDRRDRVVLATKFGFASPGAATDLEPQQIRQALESSLRRLRTDYVDVYQIHSPDLRHVAARPEWVDTLNALRDEGKIRAIGLSARSPADAVAALARFDVDALQVNFNLIDHRAADEGLFAKARERGIAIIARTPLAFGYLTGRLSGEADFIGEDHRNRWPEEQLRRWADAPALFRALCDRRHCTPAQLALLFCLSPDAVSTTIPGMMSVAHLDENVAACALPPLTPVELEQIGAIYQAHQFFVSPAKAAAVQ